MKFFYCTVCLLLLAGNLPAQTNVAAATNAAAKPRPERPPILINSEHADFDLTARQAVYWDNVRVDDSRMQLTCERLTADMPPSQPGSVIKHIVAETNVVIDFVDEKGETNHATGDKAVYDFNVQNGATNETVTLTGHARLKNSQGTLTGEPIIWDRIRNHLTAVNQKMVVNPSAASVLTGTNAPAPKTNSSSKMSDRPLSKTNLPPGTIQSLDRIKGGNEDRTP